MASFTSARELIDDAKSQVLLLMQEGDTAEGFVPNEEWADLMFTTWLQLKQAGENLSKAEYLDQ